MNLTSKLSQISNADTKSIMQWNPWQMDYHYYHQSLILHEFHFAISTYGRSNLWTDFERNNVSHSSLKNRWYQSMQASMRMNLDSSKFIQPVTTKIIYKYIHTHRAHLANKFISSIHKTIPRYSVFWKRMERICF